MHREQVEFCNKVRRDYPEYFTDKRVVDFGSLEINGNNRYLFKDCNYIGVDLKEGKNVDVVSLAQDYYPDILPDVIISTEMLEHDKHWKDSVRHMCRILRPGGLLIITCATDGREEHGTEEKHPESSPFTTDYYENISIKDFIDIIEENLNIFETYTIDKYVFDLRFMGIKYFIPLEKSK